MPAEASVDHPLFARFFDRFAGKDEEATRWYTQIVTGFADHRLAPKARGSIDRLSLVNAKDSKQNKVLKLAGVQQNGAAFDSAYASAQVDAHQKTLNALKGYAASGDNAQLKTFATGMIPTVTAHLNMAKGLK